MRLAAPASALKLDPSLARLYNRARTGVATDSTTRRTAGEKSGNNANAPSDRAMRLAAPASALKFDPSRRCHRFDREAYRRGKIRK